MFLGRSLAVAFVCALAASAVAQDGTYQVSAIPLGSFLVTPAQAQVPCVPNPNTTPLSNAPPGYVNGCNLPASALNAPGFVSPATVQDSQTAAMTADRFDITGVSQPGASGQAIYNQSVFSGNSTTFNGYDALRGVTIAPASSTVNTITGVAGYTINNTVPSGQRSQTAALFGVGVCAVNSSNCWGIDTITSDNPTQTNTGVTAGTGKFLFNEFDLNITSPNTQGANLQLGGTALPTSTTLSVNALGINKLWGAGGAGTGTALYANGLVISDACCATGLLIGASALSGTNVVGMPATLNYRGGAGTLQNVTLTAGSGSASGSGFVSVGGSSGGSLAATTGLEAGGTGALLLAGDVALAKGSNSATGPGAGFLKLEIVAGTNAGTCKLIAYAGTSTTPSTIIDNVGGGC